MATVILTKQTKYLIAIGCTLLVIGAIYRWYGDIQQLVSIQDEIEMKAQKLAKYEQILKEKEKIEAEYSSVVQAIQQSENRLLTGDTPALAAAEMQNILSKIAGESQLQIPTMRIMNPVESAHEFYNAIPIQLTMICSIKQLRDILYKIETHEKLFVIKNLRIRSMSNYGTDAIETTLTVEGYMKNKKG